MVDLIQDGSNIRILHTKTGFHLVILNVNRSLMIGSSVADFDKDVYKISVVPPNNVNTVAVALTYQHAASLLLLNIMKVSYSKRERSRSFFRAQVISIEFIDEKNFIYICKHKESVQRN
jgi:hypothetical protein